MKPSARGVRDRESASIDFWPGTHFKPSSIVPQSQTGAIGLRVCPAPIDARPIGAQR